MVAEKLPDPPVPPEVDLRAFEFMPLKIAQLFGSEFHARTSDAEWRAGVTLWLKSWHQVPAGSLPDDDVALARLAELGRDVRGWRKVKAGAMRGWFKCSDGRLYHAVVAGNVLEGWEGRLQERWRKECDRLRKENKRRSDVGQPLLGIPTFEQWKMGVIPPETAPRSAGNPTENALKGKGQGKGQGEGKGSNKHPPPPQPEPTLFAGDEAREFERWWARYPRKVGKGQARKAWKAARSKASPEQLMAGVERYVAEIAEKGTEERYVKHPTSWLNGECWGDELGLSAATQQPAPSGDAEADLWRTRMRAFQANGAWPERHFGPKPGESGCQVPAAVLREFGYAPKAAA